MLILVLAAAWNISLCRSLLISSFLLQQDSFSEDMDDSPFSKIPAELRVQIFEHVLVQNDPISIASLDDYRERHRGNKSSSGSLPAPLLVVCRAFRSECTPIFYSSNRFLIKLERTREDTLDVLHRWRNSIGPKKFGMVRYLEWQLTCATIGSEETPPSVFDDMSTIAVLRSLSLQAASINDQCLTRIRLRLVCFPEAATSNVPFEPSIGIVIDARNVQACLMTQLEDIVDKMRAAKGHDEYLQMLLGRYHVGRLIKLLRLHGGDST